MPGQDSIDEFVEQLPARLRQMPEVQRAAFDLIDAHITFEEDLTGANPRGLSLGTTINPTGDFREYQRYFPQLFQVSDQLRPVTVEEFAQKFVEVYARYWDPQRQVFTKIQPVHKEQLRRAISEGIIYHHLDMMFLNDPKAPVYMNPDSVNPAQRQRVVEANSFLSNAGILLDRYIQKA